MRLITILSLVLASTPVPATRSPPHPTSPALGDVLRPTHLQPRQDEAVTSMLEPTATESEVLESSTEDEQRPTKTLSAVDQPLPLAATIGLIMPNPWTTNYVGVNYTFGFVDAVERPAPTIGGWLRHVQPLLVFPNYTVAVFPGSGNESPEDPGAVPEGSSGLCGATAENWVQAYKFMFLEPGWYMFVVNQTWFKPTIYSDNTCRLPIVSQKSFFATQTISIAATPTRQGAPLIDPTAAYTVFADESTVTPGRMPYDETPTTYGQKLAIGFGIAGGVIALACIAGVIWWVRKKHKMERETLAFSRLSEADRAAFLAENPDHFLNPNRPSKRSQRWPGGGWGGKDGPPAPPGTMAYAQWYMAQMRNRQLGGLGGWRWGGGRQGQGYESAIQSQAPWGAGYGYQGVPTYGQQVPMTQAGVPQVWPTMASQGHHEPVMVYRT